VHVVVFAANRSAGHALANPVQVSATSQVPADARHSVVRNLSTQVLAPPRHLSIPSHAPPFNAPVHVVVFAANRSAGHALLAPVQVSATSHTPADPRHTAPALPAACVHVPLLQVSAVHGLPSSHWVFDVQQVLVQPVPQVHEPLPLQVSPVVQVLLSLHPVPLARLVGGEHWPWVVGSHVPGLWHAVAGQVTGIVDCEAAASQLPAGFLQKKKQAFLFTSCGVQVGHCCPGQPPFAPGVHPWAIASP
jgi:hypothetical protein